VDMVEKVAKAIYEAQINDKVPDELWEVCKGTTAFKPAFDSARAAIAAMRNCTPAMLDAGSAAHPAGGYTRGTLLNDIIECEWVAMCDAALECSTKPDEK